MKYRRTGLSVTTNIEHKGYNKTVIILHGGLFMETIKKIGLLFLAFFSFVCIVGGIGTLYYCQVESSNLFATGLIPVGAIYFYLLWPTLKKYLF